MENQSTFLSEKAANEVIHSAAEEIRLFLAFVNDPNADSPYGSLKDSEQAFNALSKDTRISAQAYQDHPDQFSDENMLLMGEGLEEALTNNVRIEVRKANGVSGAAQVVAKGIEGAYRTIALERLGGHEGVALKFAGKSSIEFNVPEVNKALPFKYLAGHLERVLEQMQYTPGDLIDAKKSKTIIAADGDSTIYGGPTLTTMPTLSESPTKEFLNEYLRFGGIFMLISGNDLERTEARIREAIDNGLKRRCILVGNGAASMAVFDEDGHLKEVEDYRLNALVRSNKDQDLDVIYIGDDGDPNGNDIAGFKEVGFERSFLVEEEGARIVEELRDHYIAGQTEACAQLFSVINTLIKEKSTSPFFTKDFIAQAIKRLR